MEQKYMYFFNVTKLILKSMNRKNTCCISGHFVNHHYMPTVMYKTGSESFICLHRNAIEVI